MQWAIWEGKGVQTGPEFLGSETEAARKRNARLSTRFDPTFAKKKLLMKRSSKTWQPTYHGVLSGEFVPPLSPAAATYHVFSSSSFSLPPVSSARQHQLTLSLGKQHTCTAGPAGPAGPALLQRACVADPLFWAPPFRRRRRQLARWRRLRNLGRRRGERTKRGRLFHR